MKYLISLIGSVILLTISQIAQAEESAAPQGAALKDEKTVLLQLNQLSSDLEEALSTRNFGEVSEVIPKMRELSKILGLEGLDSEARVLTDLAENEPELERATFLMAQSQILSPGSTELNFKRALFFIKNGDGAYWGEIKIAAVNLFKQPLMLLKLFCQGCYPLLWAVTFCTYLLLGVEVFKQLFLIQTGRINLYLFPILIVVGCLASILAGPLVALFASGIALVLFGRERLIVVVTGVLLLSWAVFIPFREAINNYFLETYPIAVDSYFDGRAAQIDDNWLSASELTPFLNLRNAQYLTSTGRYDEALATLAIVEKVPALSSYALVARGNIYLLRNELNEAEKVYSEANIGTPSFNFNFSKIKFDLLKVSESKKLLNQALKKDPKLVEKFQQLEHNFGIKHFRSLAPEPLSVFRYLSDSLSQTKNNKKIEVLFSSLFIGLAPPLSYLPGVILLLLGFFAPRDSFKKQIPFELSRLKISQKIFLVLIPASGLFLIGARWSALLISLLVISLALVAAGWPSDLLPLHNSLVRFNPFVIFFVAFFTFACWKVAVNSSRDRYA